MAVCGVGNKLITGDADFAGEGDTLVTAARKMKNFDVGALPICRRRPAPQQDADPPRHHHVPGRGQGSGTVTTGELARVKRSHGCQRLG